MRQALAGHSERSSHPSSHRNLSQNSAQRPPLRVNAHSGRRGRHGFAQGWRVSPCRRCPAGLDDKQFLRAGAFSKELLDEQPLLNFVPGVGRC